MEIQKKRIVQKIRVKLWDNALKKLNKQCQAIVEVLLEHL